jgi:DNA-binding response OmpR family regulator
LEQNKLEELNQIKSQFFTNISHEFKTPLTMILSPLGSLITSAKGEDEKNSLGYIRRSALRLQNLVNQLMDFKSLENSSLGLVYSFGNITTFVGELVAVFKPLANTHGISINFVGNEPIDTAFDHDKTEKVLYNLLSNAVKFTPRDGQITVSIEIKKRHTQGEVDKPYVRMAVSNTGSKIDPQQIGQIFQNYYHIDRPNSLSQPGTGIGLAFSKELVELQNGYITVESNDEATCFMVDLPLRPQSGDMKALKNQSDDKFGYSQELLEVLKFEKSSIDLRTSNDKAPPVLIVEDNRDLRELLRSSLSKEYKVTVAVNGLEALDLIAKVNPVLIISDIVMDKLDGIQLCAKLKSNIEFNHIPIILLTASNTDSLKLRGMETGADVYLEKPFDLEFLKLQIRNIIQTRKAQREAFSKKISPTPEKVAVNSNDENFVMKAIAIVEEHIDNSDFDVDAFVAEMGMSRTALYQKLRALTDLSINEFIINIRLKRAIQLLEDSDLTVSEVAFKVGFSSPSYFGICFKRHFKMSPGAFIETNTSRKTS